MIDLTLASGQAELYSRALPTRQFTDYITQHGLDLDVVLRVVGACGVLPIRAAGDGMFDFGDDEDEPGFICEAMADDGVTIDDLVAWPMTQPQKPMTMLGRAVILGLEYATNPASYHANRPVRFYRTPLALLQAGGKGAVILDTTRAGRILLDLPGRVAGEDARHARELLAMAERVVDRSKFVAPNIADLRIAA